MIIAIIILILSIIAFLLLCFILWMLKHQLSTKNEILDYLFKKYGIGWKRIIKRNGGCYINGEWYIYYNKYLCKDYICLKLKKYKGMTYENKTK